MYEQEIQFLQKVEDKLDTNNIRDLLSKDECVVIEAKYPLIPKEYLAYLMEVGAGSAREDQYMIYGMPTLCHEDTDYSWYETKGVNYLVIGDDFTGNLYAFNIDTGFTPVLLDHECMEEFVHNGTIKSFFREMMLMDENGNDQREP
ncbi:SMI1/KNR4 family protein [Arenicella xantha]|uniref:SUKH superfamily protein n=1 Tax=Arenicella xantha TaxID=644221 RepID=A0A395JHH3_9GAMM|nr:SMI1/KNR4 family protein [Arenicella xantha]RBP49590.1 hypothetical protein DFR28_10315 [Arenicella xantha]